jgi:hypothetical protein
MVRTSKRLEGTGDLVKGWNGGGAILGSAQGFKQTAKTPRPPRGSAGGGVRLNTKTTKITKGGDFGG